MQQSQKLDGLQIARAVAALSIAYFHSWHVTMLFPTGTSYPIPILRDYGWIAVDFFFAISGFVICLVTTSPHFAPLPFLIRRIFRLYPLWIATSFVFLELTRFLGRNERQTDAFFNWSLTLLPTEGFPFYDLGWSLQHEMAFYVLAAVTVPLFGLRGLIAALIAGLVAHHSMMLPWYFEQFFSYYGNFLAGIMAYLTYQRASRFGVVIPVLICAALFFVLPFGRATYPIPLYFALIAFLNIPAKSQIGVALGDASYSIYLIHPLVFAFIYIRLQPPLPPEWMQEPLRFGAMAATCLIGLLSWRLYEKPMMRLGDSIIGFVAGWWAARRQPA